jgi:hypothetical protein
MIHNLAWSSTIIKQDQFELSPPMIQHNLSII